MRIPHGLRAALAGQAAPPAPSSDANFENVSLLLHGDGTNGAQNNTFTDGSANNFTITRNGNTTQGTFSPFSPTGWSGYFDGTGDYLSWSGTTLSGDFTVECWVYKTATDASGYTNVFSSSSQNTQLAFDNTTAGSIVLVISSSIVIGVSGTAVTPNTWHHLAWVREGSTCRAYVNGVQQGTGTSSASMNLSLIGQFQSGGYEMNGYISNARITNACLYPGGTTFTPSTSPLTTTVSSGTVQLLTLQDNRFKDNSTNNFAITRFGDTRIEAFSPFNPTAAYSASTHGGSGYFDGSGDRIYCTPSNLTGQFTIEGWWYANAFQSTPVFCGNWSVGCLLRYSGAQIQWYMPGGSGAAAYTLTTGQWYHMAVTRDSSNVVRVFANGVQLFSLTNSASITMTNYCIGSESTASNTTDIWNGYISGFRILNGTCLYNSAFTPPTSPPTAIANTNLLVNFTNGGIIDNASKNVLETVGNAQISTSVMKFGTGSMYFDGTGDACYVPNTKNNTSFAGDFTLECWVYPLAVGGFRAVFVFGTAAGGTEFGLWFYNSGVFLWLNNTWNDSGLTATTNTWQHLAVTRSGSTIRVFKDGVMGATTFTNSSQLVNANNWNIGAGWSGDTTYAFNGYIDDLRITRGVARYTANFTPPTATFPDL